MFNESEALELAKSGNEKAFSDLVSYSLTKIRPAIYNSFNSLSKEDFEDALQSATVKAWQKMENFRGDASFPTWFFTILRNEILNVIKTASRIRKHEISREEISAMHDDEKSSNFEAMIPRDLLDDSMNETAQTLLQKQEDMNQYREMLNSVLVKLKPSHREIIQMVFEQEKSYKEVSDELNIPIGTVMSRLYFARRNAQKLIQQYAQRNDIQLLSVGRLINTSDTSGVEANIGED
jgi:RNA polymerase sigma-70 factor, ECF subfamily